MWTAMIGFGLAVCDMEFIGRYSWFVIDWYDCIWCSFISYNLLTFVSKSYWSVPSRKVTSNNNSNNNKYIFVKRKQH